MTECVYRAFGASGNLLYVGVTSNPGSRLKDHQRDKDWWTAVAVITVEHFDTRDEALDAEAIAITSEGPAYNIASPTRMAQRSSPIKRLRVAHGMTRAELAEKISSTYGDHEGDPISERTIARWETTGRILVDRALELAAIFGVSLDHLFGADLARGDGNGNGDGNNGERVAA